MLVSFLLVSYYFPLLLSSLLYHFFFILNLDENKNLFKFDAKGDGPPRYTVVNLQWVNESNEFKWVPVGFFGKYLLLSFHELHEKENTTSSSHVRKST